MVVPVKTFGVAKERLGAILDQEARSALGREVAARTLEVVKEAGFPVSIVTDDAGVAEWASGLGADVIAEPEDEPPGLDRAARAGLRYVSRRRLRWAIVHADLPLLRRDDLLAVAAAVPKDGVVLAPSHDGGTNVVAGDVSDFRFAYGPGSFRRHLFAATGGPVRILVRTGLALDLDTADDLAEIGRLIAVSPGTGSGHLERSRSSTARADSAPTALGGVER